MNYWWFWVPGNGLTTTFFSIFFTKFDSECFTLKNHKILKKNRRSNCFQPIFKTRKPSYGCPDSSLVWMNFRIILKMRVVWIRSAWSPCYSKDPCISKKCNFLVFASKAKINIFGICFWCRGTKASPYFKKKKTSKNVEIAAFEVIVETHFYIALYLFFYFLGLYGSYSTTKNHSQRNQGGRFGTWNYTPTSFEIHDSK